MHITFQKELVETLEIVRLGIIQCRVNIEDANEKLQDFAARTVKRIEAERTLSEISLFPPIKSNKTAYRQLGKDPSRYRPSAEALTRRIVSGKGLYPINNVVDLLNLISLESGFSIGGYDADKIEGEISFGIGAEKEPYKAIGRGNLNIEHLPVFRDKLGAFGSPTSDSLRTMVTTNTENFLMVIIDFAGLPALEKTLEHAELLYREYTGATEIDKKITFSKP